jgi:hypothetical protein
MKTDFTRQKLDTSGNALLLTMIMTGVALAILAGAMAWSASSTRLTYRSIQYMRSEAAAEAATEKVISQISRDFLYGGENLVANNLSTYQTIVPTVSDSSYWGTWQFNDANGDIGQTYVQSTSGTNFIQLNGPYTGLQGYGSTYTVVSHARDTASIQDVTAGVLQQLQLVRIPIFQFGMYSSGDMEISCGEPFTVTGHVHSNGTLYVEPDNSLTFESGVTAVVNILFQRDPLDPRGLVPNGGVVYVQPDEKISPVAALTLPIGTTNTPEAIQEIIEPPPPGEDPNSPLGKLRYYNESDMILTVSDTGVTATSGEFNGLATSIPTNELALFVSTTTSFVDNREGKTVLPINIDIGSLKTWSETNSDLRPVLIAANQSSTYIMNSIYVVDNRNLPSTSLGAVYVFDGTQLPTNGLTVATGRPLYVQGDYNETDATNLGSADTSDTRPASLAADAITILSDAWQDGTTGPGITPPNATPTTVNAALLTGVVETTSQNYSGGMENFPRFLETWGTTIFTYNGSMVKMFPSLYATGVWGQNYVYTPPSRNWAYDANFNDPTKLPPLTPSLLKVIRGQWANVPPDSNVAVTTP